jgi:hypothetical protein
MEEVEKRNEQAKACSTFPWTNEPKPLIMSGVFRANSFISVKKAAHHERSQVRFAIFPIRNVSGGAWGVPFAKNRA